MYNITNLVSTVENKLRFVSLEVGPNYQIDDGFIALSQLILGKFTNFTESKNQSINWFRTYLNRQNDSNFQIYFTTNARHGLSTLLQTLNLPENSEVLVQGFSCIVVPNAVLQANLKPITCDISTENYNFDLDKIQNYITEKTKVWIIQHNFGLVIDMIKACEIAKKYNLIIIEDCAHSLGAKYTGSDFDNQNVGSFGDATIFSFGRDKIVSTTNGGAVVFNQNQLDWQNRFETAYNKFQPSNHKQNFENLLYTVLVVFFIRPYYKLFLGKAIAVANLKFRLTGEIYTRGEKHATDFANPTKYSDKLFPLLWNQLKKCEKYNLHRKKIAQIYAEYFQLNFDSNSVYLRFPLCLKQITKSDNLNHNSERYQKTMIKAKQNGVFLGNWYTQVFVGSSYDDKQTPYNYTTESIPNICKLVQKQVLNLPTNINTSVDEAKLICEIIHNVA